MESFLKEKATVQEKKHISRTYLILDDDEESLLRAYFTVAISSMEGADLECSNQMRKKMNINNGLAISYLIGQVGKCDGSAKGLGKFAIEKAIMYILDANTLVGCRVIMIDCRPPPIRYYADNGFTLVGCNPRGDLNQMIRIIETKAIRA